VGIHRESSASAVGMTAQRGGLTLLDLLSTPERLAAALSQTLAERQWFDAFLLSAGILQLLEDRIHPDPLQLRRGAAYLRGGGSAWSGAAARAADTAAAMVAVVHQPPWVSGQLLHARHSMAQLTSRLAGTVQNPSRANPTAEELPYVDSHAKAAAALVRGDVVRLPACFRSFDLHPDDVQWLTRAFLEKYGAPVTPVCVVGVRTSGSYLAPLHAASMHAAGAPSVGWLTYRPGRPFRPWESTLLRAVARSGGRVVLTDDPPGTGASLAAGIEAIAQVGVPRHRITMSLSLFSDDPELPPRLSSCAALLQPWSSWTVHQRLEPHRVERALGRVLPDDWRVDRCERLNSARPRKSREHVHARYAVEVSDLLNGSRRGLDIAAEGAGLGYLGQQAVGVAMRLEGLVPTVYGFEEGLLYRDWLYPPQRPLDEATTADVVAHYVARRRQALPAEADPTPAMRGRDPAWEVAAKQLSHAYGPLAPVARTHLLEGLTRRLMRPQHTSVVDGATDTKRWLPDPAQGDHWTKVDFHQRAFSNLEVACYDAAFDLAGAVGDPPSREFRGRLLTAYHRETGELVDRERWLLYLLSHHWGSLEAGEIDNDVLARRSADAVHEYLAECYLQDLHAVEGPLCAIDLDGVLETERHGFAASGPTGASALRSLISHGYRPVLATGRSLVDARDRCTAFGLSGAVAEYGAVVYDHGRGVSEDLRNEAETELIDCVRDELARQGLVVDPGHRYAVRARHDGGPLPSGLVERTPLLGHPELQLVHGEGQTDVVVRRLDKAAGLDRLRTRLGEPRCAFAIGDSMSDLSMLRMADMARAPRNADPRLRTAGIAVTRRAYQAGLLDACSSLLGHRAGSCAQCQAPPLPRRTRELLAALSVPDAGLAGAPWRALRLYGLVTVGSLYERGHRVAARGPRPITKDS
jgi:hydroxymethylpyrimidine pyrophosphatase-like HAD family hydrolase